MSVNLELSKCETGWGGLEGREFVSTERLSEETVRQRKNCQIQTLCVFRRGGREGWRERETETEREYNDCRTQQQKSSQAGPYSLVKLFLYPYKCYIKDNWSYIYRRHCIVTKILENSSSLTQYILIADSTPSIQPSPPHIYLLPQIPLLLSPSEKSKSPGISTEHGITRCIETRHKPSRQGW